MWCKSFWSNNYHRNAHPSARVKLQSLYKFLQGHLAPPVKETLEDMRQFTAFFPHHLHRHARYKGTYKVVESMVFIHDPDTSYMKPEDIERFKRLSGLSELALNWEDARSFQHGQRSDRDEERQVIHPSWFLVCKGLQSWNDRLICRLWSYDFIGHTI